jgi:hypothetical protein
MVAIAISYYRHTMIVWRSLPEAFLQKGRSGPFFV